MTFLEVQDAPRSRRMTRRPQHQFFLRHEPWQIVPFMIAPVLPGETMRRLMVQSRCVTDPVKNRTIGWWCELYFFYCSFSSPRNADTWKTAMLDPTASPPTASSVSHFKYRVPEGNEVTEECLVPIIENYFRNEGEDWDEWTINSQACAAINQNNWMHSLAAAADVTAEVDVDVDAIGAGANIMASEIEQAMIQYQVLRRHGLTQLSYDEYLRTHGVQAPTETLAIPELLRYVRSWQYPSNTIDPTDGSATTAVSWSIAERADKNRYFREPGFIVGVQVVRPKVYFRNQHGAAAQLLTDAYKWLPAILGSNPEVGMVRHATPAADEVLALNDDVNADSGIDDAFQVDMRDLFMRGDQWFGVDSASTDCNMVDLPYQSGTAPMNTSYPNDGDADHMFVGTASEAIEADGVVRLEIATRVEDTSPATPSITALPA